MKSKYIDTAAIVQVIGSVFKNPSLLDKRDKYNIIEEDFQEDFHKILFGAINNLYFSGVSNISISTIVDFLENKPKQKSIFQENKGEEYLYKLDKAITSTEAFDFYYNRMKKMTLLRAYDEMGVDIRFLYDIDNILDVRKKQKQEEFLQNCSIEDIVKKVDEKIDNIKIKYADFTYDESIQAGAGVLELLNRLEEEPAYGLPLYGNFINTITRGCRLKKLYLRSAGTGIGKAIPNYTLIPTPSGIKKVGEIKEGDYLFGQDGKPTKVLKIHPQQEKKEIWKVTFADGRVAECCGEHLWEYRYETHDGYSYRVEDIKTLYERTLKLKNGLKRANGKGYRFHIKLNKAVEFPRKDYSLSPYVMGAFLGDGSFRYSKKNKCFTFSSENEDIPNMICKEFIDQDIIAQKNSDYNFNWIFRDKKNLKHPIWVKEFLKDYPELWNLKSEDKFIPKDYLLGSISQRKDLLQGLLDTDGSVNKTGGRVNFTTISSKLRDDVIELCHSLGYIATWSIDKREDKYTTGECYNIRIQAPKKEKLNMFRLERKVKIAKDYYDNGKREEYKDHLAIVGIEKTDVKTDMTCFTVDNVSHLFLMNDYLVTHNTRMMIADVCNLGCDKIYDNQFGWIKNGTKTPVLYISTELELEEVQTMMLAFLSNVNEEKILTNKYEEGEKERVKEAALLLLSSPIYIETVPDFSLQDIENIIKRNIRENDVSYIFYDYLHSSMKILEEVTRRSGGVKIREDTILFMMAIKLKDICNEYGVFIMTSTQLSGDFKSSDSPDQTLLRGSKAIADKIDMGSICLAPSKQDIEALQSILSTGQFEQPNLKMSIYKNRQGKFKGVYLWCKADLGVCKVQPLFMTDYGYEFINIKNIDVILKDDDKDKAF